MDYIKKLIGEFDVAVDLSDPFEQPLNYVAASDMLPILADMLKEEGQEAGAGGAGAPTRTTTGGIGVGTPVTLWGEGLPAQEVATSAGTVAYQLLCGITRRVPVVEVNGVA
ncbi:hypothetical protein EBZ02_05920 [bacterium]|nr:hypothetical protein [bacterium]